MGAPFRNHAMTLASGRMGLADGPRLGSPITAHTSRSRRNSLVRRRVVGGTPLALAAVSVQNPPSGLQNVFSVCWVRATTVVLGRPHGLSFPSFSSL